jgi:hypothetical protein
MIETGVKHWVISRRKLNCQVGKASKRIYESSYQRQYGSTMWDEIYLQLALTDVLSKAAKTEYAAFILVVLKKLVWVNDERFLKP